MGKRIGVFAILCVIAFGAFGCSQKNTETQGVQTKEVDQTINFENQTGQTIGVLCIRPNDQYDWSENLIVDAALKNNFEMPIYLNGSVPVVEGGWEVRTVFLDETEMIWDNVSLEDNTTVIFHINNGESSVEVVKNETE